MTWQEGFPKDIPHFFTSGTPYYTPSTIFSNPDTNMTSIFEIDHKGFFYNNISTIESMDFGEITE